MAKSSEFTKTLKPRRKLSVLEIIGNIIIWASPLIMAISIFIANFQTIQTAPTKLKVEFWVIILIVAILFFYINVGKKKLEQLIQDKRSNREKVTPLLALANGVVSIMPIGLAVLIFDVLQNINEPIEEFLIVLLCVQAFGRIILFVDSFKDAEYYD